METTHLIGAAEAVIPVLVFVGFSLSKWKKGMHDAWREEAEAYKSRAERLDLEVMALTTEVRRLSDENAKLRAKIDELLAR
jgi:cell division protein FtsB